MDENLHKVKDGDRAEIDHTDKSENIYDNSYQIIYDFVKDVAGNRQSAVNTFLDKRKALLKSCYDGAQSLKIKAHHPASEDVLVSSDQTKTFQPSKTAHLRILKVESDEDLDTLTSGSKEERLSEDRLSEPQLPEHLENRIKILQDDNTRLWHAVSELRVQIQKLENNQKCLSAHERSLAKSKQEAQPSDQAHSPDLTDLQSEISSSEASGPPSKRPKLRYRKIIDEEIQNMIRQYLKAERMGSRRLSWLIFEDSGRRVDENAIAWWVRKQPELVSRVIGLEHKAHGATTLIPGSPLDGRLHGPDGRRSQRIARQVAEKASGEPMHSAPHPSVPKYAEIKDVSISIKKDSGKYEQVMTDEVQGLIRKYLENERLGASKLSRKLYDDTDGRVNIDLNVIEKFINLHPELQARRPSALWKSKHQQVTDTLPSTPIRAPIPITQKSIPVPHRIKSPLLPIHKESFPDTLIRPVQERKHRIDTRRNVWPQKWDDPTPVKSAVDVLPRVDGSYKPLVTKSPKIASGVEVAQDSAERPYHIDDTKTLVDINEPRSPSVAHSDHKVTPSDSLSNAVEQKLTEFHTKHFSSEERSGLLPEGAPGQLNQSTQDTSKTTTPLMNPGRLSFEEYLENYDAIHRPYY